MDSEVVNIASSLSVLSIVRNYERAPTLLWTMCRNGPEVQSFTSKSLVELNCARLSAWYLGGGASEGEFRNGFLSGGEGVEGDGSPWKQCAKSSSMHLLW